METKKRIIPTGILGLHHGVSTDSDRGCLTKISLTEHHAEVSDGHMLVRVELPDEYQGGDPCLIPADLAKDGLKLAKGSPMVQLTDNGETLGLSCDAGSVEARGSGSGDFVDSQVVVGGPLGRKHTHEVTLDAVVFLKMMKTMGAKLTGKGARAIVTLQYGETLEPVLVMPSKVGFPEEVAEHGFGLIMPCKK